MVTYILDITNLGLKVELNVDKNLPWYIVCYSDSDSAGDPDTRRSVKQIFLAHLGVPVSWKSKAQISVALLSSETE